MSENVASMDSKDRDVFTGLWRTKPVRACSRGLSQVRRPRYYWFNWEVPVSPGVVVQHQADVVAVSFTATLPNSSEWVDPGWIWCGDTPVTAKGPKKVLRIQRSVPSPLSRHAPEASVYAFTGTAAAQNLR